MDSITYIEHRLGFCEEELMVFPKYFLIETVNICNARCIMCGINFDGKKKATISDELFQKIASEIIEHSKYVEKVMLYLDGEPLLDKGMEDKIKMLKCGGVKNVNISSNASLLTKERAISLMDAGLDEIYITVDSLKKDIYEKIRVGLNFDVVLGNVLGLIELRNSIGSNLKIRVQMIKQELNVDEDIEFLAFWKSKLRESDPVVVTKAHNWGSQVDVMKFGDEDVVNQIPCIALWGTFVTHLSGDVPLCCMDSATKYPIGNLNHQSIKEIWNSEEINRIRRLHLSGNRDAVSICNGCTLWRDDKIVMTK